MPMTSFLLLLMLSVSAACQQQPNSPCKTNPIYRQFDFWIGEWDVYGPNGKKAGDSKIQMILDSCIILENWKSSTANYSGKSFNTYNAVTNQWQQTWVDNNGGTIEFLEGKSDNNKMIFKTKPFIFSKDTFAIRRLTFYNLAKEKVRQHGEISKNNGITWLTEYDLEYRRIK